MAKIVPHKPRAKTRPFRLEGIIPPLPQPYGHVNDTITHSACQYFSEINVFFLIICYACVKKFAASGFSWQFLRFLRQKTPFGLRQDEKNAEKFLKPNVGNGFFHETPSRRSVENLFVHF